ncbi:MAG: ion channel [Pseudomonadota bacterium]
MVNQLAVAGAVIGVICFVHALFIALGAALLRNARKRRSRPNILSETFALLASSLWLCVAHAIEIGLWGGAFLRLGIFSDLEPAMYFSAVSYTTLGFGDVILDEPWRLLSGACAASGLLMFGLSAAFLLATVTTLDLSPDDTP